MRTTGFLLLTFTACLCWGQFPARLTIQESLYPAQTGCSGYDCGSSHTVHGISRTSDPVTVGIPLADSAGITSASQLSLDGAKLGQFRKLAQWPSGNWKWVLVDTQADIAAGASNTRISVNKVVTGGGNFGGPDLATSNGTTITVITGAATFTIKKTNFNLFDKVVVGGKVLVSDDGHSSTD